MATAFQPSAFQNNAFQIQLQTGDAFQCDAFQNSAFQTPDCTPPTPVADYCAPFRWNKTNWKSSIRVGRW